MTNILFKIARIYHSQFKCNFLKNEKDFHYFLFNFWNLHQILNILKENMIAIANAFPKLQTVKHLVRPLSKKCFFRTRFDSKHVKASQILPKSPWERFYHVFSPLSEKLISKMPPLMLGETLGVFFNTFTAESKYPVLDGENLQIPIQMEISQNDKLFLNFLFNFWNLHQILNTLKKRMIVTAKVFPKLKTVKIFVRTLSKKRHFRTRLESQHVKTSQIFAKSPWKRFYHVFHNCQGSWFRKWLPL